MKTPYTDMIKSLAPNYNPRHIEAFMRSEYSTLDHLPPDKFRHEVTMGSLCVDEGGLDFAEQVAKSFGL